MNLFEREPRRERKRSERELHNDECKPTRRDISQISDAVAGERLDEGCRMNGEIYDDDFLIVQ